MKLNLWQNHGLQLLFVNQLGKKNELFKIYLKNKCEYNHCKYKIYRNKLKHLIIVSKKLYFNDYFTKNLNNVKETWKGIKQLVTIKATKLSGPSKIKVNNTVLTDSKSIANAFNNYFSTIGPSLAANIPYVNMSFYNFLSTSGSPQLNSFYLSPTNPVEIEQVIGNLNPNKATGPYSIPIKLIICLRSFLI